MPGIVNKPTLSWQWSSVVRMSVFLGEAPRGAYNAPTDPVTCGGGRLAIP